MNRTNTLRFAIVGLLLTGFGCSKDAKDKGDADTPDAEVEDGSGTESDGGGRKDGGPDGGRDGSTGGDSGGSCITACAADDCGQVPNDCGDFLACGDCDTGWVCGLNAPNKCGVPPPPPCTPLDPAATCVNKCGAVSDGCSGVIVCNDSNGGTTCGTAQNCTNSTCVDTGPACTPLTCMDRGHECGQDGDGCGGTIDCMACPPTQHCVFDTQLNHNVCEDIPPDVCTPLMQADACLSGCGVVGDGCGGTITCPCLGGQTCGGNGIPGQCGSGNTCTAIPAAEVCAGKCGSQSDGCGGTYTCDASNGGQACNAAAGESCGGGGTPNVCGKAPCTPRSPMVACPVATGENKSCGVQPDGCGGLIDCGGCSSNQQCGLTTPSVCGTIPSCMPVAVTTACASKCGTVPDGCGGSYVCNNTNGGVTCTGIEYCGANNLPNQCGTPPVSCVAKTCAELGHTCGLASDGCGHVLNCWDDCADDNPNCTDSCPNSGACLANQQGVQSCVAGAPSCTGSLCSSVPTSCAMNSPTRLTGRVVTPGRLVSGSYINRVPVPNAMVYIPADANAALPSVFEGVQVGNEASCGRCEDEELVGPGQSVLAAAVTDYKGDFTLEGRVPVGTAFRLVIKVGKWRRVVQIPAGNATACGTSALNVELTRLAGSSTDGLTGTHLPKIAVSTGYVDEMECVFRNIGLAESEFTLPTGTGRIHMYRANGAQMAGATCTGTYQSGGQTRQCSANSNAGCVNLNTGCTYSNQDSYLYSDQARLNSYDLVVWDCEGKEEQHNTHDPKIVQYVDNGGRMFASHYSYTWIEGNGTLDQSADWGASGSNDSGTGYISMPTGNTARTGANPIKSTLFRNWLDYQGSLNGSTAGMLSNPPLATPQFTITDPRDRAGASVGPATDEWMYRNNNGAKIQQLSFNTPYNALEANICGRVAYSGFHVAATDNNDPDDFFPGVCSNGALSAQEKVLVFMLFDLATCVSAGDPPQPPTCTPKTTAELCPNENDACGVLNDGCGGVVNCGGCAAGNYCDGNSCRPQQCTPSTCQSLGYSCGNHADGCGGIARNAQGAEGCGTCSGGQTCGLTTPGICGGCAQIPYSTACPTNSCGSVSNGCGGTHDCGLCPIGVCGGGGANRCGAGSCTPIPLSTACAGKNCGSVADGCGGTHNCGVCTAPDTCGGDGRANVCGHVTCTPKTVGQACTGLQCGWVSDGCGGGLYCGDCPSNGVCGGAGPNLCGMTCNPTTCTAVGAECGAVSDQCGGLLNCGNCPVGQTCGADGPNQCGTGSACTPRTCQAAGAECGLVGDGCGGVLDCGACVAPETCGGDGQANQCGMGTGGCTKLTCEGAGVECGTATDGCGGLQDCACPAGYTCKSGNCEEIII